MIAINRSVGGKPVPGKVPPTFDGVNDPTDVRNIQTLLNQAYGSDRLPVTGRCDQATVNAIAEFQRLWPGMKVDSRIDPGGATLRRLNEAVTPLKLNKIELGLIAKGGYLISYDGVVPPAGYKVLLGLTSEANSIDVTGRPKNDLMSPDNLQSLLKIINKLNLWGTKVDCRLFVKRDGNLISQSDPPQKLDCPVKPYSGALGAELLKKENVGSFTYPGIGLGRYFYMPPIDSSYYFAYYSKFETVNALRGFDCITYAGSAFGANASDKVTGKDGKLYGCMAGYGTQLAEYLKATKVDMEAKKGLDIKEFFKTNSKGTYLMWKEGHTTVVVDGVVHEFTNRSPAGYHEASTQEWPYGNDIYWIRKLPKDL